MALSLSSAPAFAAPPALRATAALESRVALPAVGQHAAGAQAASSNFAFGALAVASVGGAAVLTGAQRRAAARAEKRKAAVAVCAGPKVLEGTGGPFPEDCWDPAGLTKGKDDETLRYYRAAELKHGRVAMVACLGWFHTAAGWHPIGDGAVRSQISDDPLIAAQQLPVAGWLQIFFTIMSLEWLTTFICKAPEEKPWDVLGVSDLIADEEYPEWKNQKMRELNNGRLAMVAIIGLIAQDAYTGQFFGEIQNICAVRWFMTDGQPVCDIALPTYGGEFAWPMIYPEAPSSMPVA